MNQRAPTHIGACNEPAKCATYIIRNRRRMRYPKFHTRDMGCFESPMTGPKKPGSMATQNNLHIPDDLLSAVNEAAGADGKTTDEIAADALRRYLAHRKLEELGKYGREQSLLLGYTEADVPRLIAESRRENRCRSY
jgi:hypothetical protein